MIINNREINGILNMHPSLKQIFKINTKLVKYDNLLIKSNIINEYEEE